MQYKLLNLVGVQFLFDLLCVIASVAQPNMRRFDTITPRETYVNKFRRSPNYSAHTRRSEPLAPRNTVVLESKGAVPSLLVVRPYQRPRYTPALMPGRGSR